MNPKFTEDYSDEVTAEQLAVIQALVEEQNGGPICEEDFEVISGPAW